MPRTSVDFDGPDLAAQLEKLTPAEIDELPFGVIRLDRELRVLLFSKVESEQSGFSPYPVGEKFFPRTQHFNSEDFRGRIESAMADGKVDLEFGWPGEFSKAKRDMHIRVQSASGGGIWLCIER